MINSQDYSFTHCLDILVQLVRVNVVPDGLCYGMVKGYGKARKYATKKQSKYPPTSFCFPEVGLCRKSNQSYY